MLKKFFIVIILLLPIGLYAAYSTEESSFPFATDWIEADCLPHSQISQVTADTANICKDFIAVEDANGVIDATPDIGQGSTNFRIRAGATGVNTAAGDGMGITFPNAFLMSATNTPTFEAVARIGQVQLATSTSFVFMGFATTTGVSPDYSVQPGGCMFVASSTRANWQAVCMNQVTTTNYSQVDTGIASSSVITGNGSYAKFHVDVIGSTASFYIQGTSTSLTNVANITGMSVPSTTPMVPLAAVAKAHIGTSHELHIRNIKTLYIEKIW